MSLFGLGQVAQQMATTADFQQFANRPSSASIGHTLFGLPEESGSPHYAAGPELSSSQLAAGGQEDTPVQGSAVERIQVASLWLHVLLVLAPRKG